jgi:hypothetical protein
MRVVLSSKIDAQNDRAKRKGCMMGWVLTHIRHQSWVALPFTR